MVHLAGQFKWTNVSRPKRGIHWVFTAQATRGLILIFRGQSRHKTASISGPRGVAEACCVGPRTAGRGLHSVVRKHSLPITRVGDVDLQRCHLRNSTFASSLVMVLPAAMSCSLPSIHPRNGAITIPCDEIRRVVAIGRPEDWSHPFSSRRARRVLMSRRPSATR